MMHQQVLGEIAVRILSRKLKPNISVGSETRVGTPRILGVFALINNLPKIENTRVGDAK